jgi:hypothetical protein
MKQHEHDISESVANMKSALGITGDFKHSGGRIDNFRKGWAKDIWSGDVAHFWFRWSIVEVLSKCGLKRPAEWMAPDGTRTPRMYGPGNLPRCKRCESL